MTPPDHVGDDGTPHAGDGVPALSTARLRGVLDGTYAPLSERPGSLLPSVTLANTYRRDRYAYNVTATSMSRSIAQGALAAANTSRLDIACLGTSLVGGTGATAKTGSWPYRLQELLVAKGYPDGGSGLIASQSNNGSTTDARVTLGAGWSAHSASKNMLVKGVDTTSALTFTDTKPSTIVEVYYCDFATGFTWTIDGVAQTPVAATNDGLTKKVTVSGLTKANHTVVITAATGATGANPCYIHGVSFLNTTGIAVHNLGVGGNQTTDVLDITTLTFGLAGNWSELRVALLIAPRLALIQTGANDGSTLPGTYTSKITGAVSALAAVGSDTVLVTDPPTAATTRPNRLEPAALYPVADSQNVPLIDIYDRFGTWAHLSAVGQGYATDGFTVHLTDSGYAEQARVILRALPF